MTWYFCHFFNFTTYEFFLIILWCFIPIPVIYTTQMTTYILNIHNNKIKNKTKQDTSLNMRYLSKHLYTMQTSQCITSISQNFIFWCPWRRILDLWPWPSYWWQQEVQMGHGQFPNPEERWNVMHVMKWQNTYQYYTALAWFAVAQKHEYDDNCETVFNISVLVYLFNVQISTMQYSSDVTLLQWGYQLWLCAPGTHYSWVARGNVDSKLAQGL